MWAALVILASVIYFGTGLGIASLVMANKDSHTGPMWTSGLLWACCLVPGWLPIWAVGSVIRWSGLCGEVPYCAYCRRKFAKNPKGHEEAARHIETCDKHPLAAARAELARCKEQVSLLHDATIVLRRGMGGHDHWDATMRRGDGCQTCIAQREAREAADRLINKASILNMRPEGIQA